MADTIVVQRGHIGTHKMHVYPDEIPNQVWAKIEAQNAGIVAGNWQNHLVCSPASELRDIEKWGPSPLPQQVNQWRVRWPRLGSYSRLSFYSFAAARNWDYIVRLWNAGYSATFYDGTVVVEHNDTDYTERVTLEWNMEEAGLSGYLNQDIFIEVIAKPSEDPEDDWTIRVNEFSIYTANRPL